MARPSRPRAGRRPLGRRILILCEGSATEVAYFQRVRVAMRLPRAAVVIRDLGGGGPNGVAKAVAAVAPKAGHARAEEAFDEIWVVCDTDDPRTSGASAAVARMVGAGVEVALSNPAFEVWLLLHHGDADAPMTAAQAKRLVAQRGEARVADWPHAAARAERQRAAALDGDGDLRAAQLVLLANPSTNVDEVLRLLASEAARRRV